MSRYYFPFSALWNFLTITASGFFVYAKNRSSKVQQGFFYFIFSVGFWSLAYIFWQIATNAQEALSWCRLLTLGSIWIPVFFYYFVICFLGLQENKKYLLWYKAGFVYTLFFTFLLPTNFMIKALRPMLIFLSWPIPGPFYLHWLISFLINTIYTHALLYQVYRQHGDRRRDEVKYVFLGIAIGFGGGSTNFPQWYGLDFLPLGNILEDRELTLSHGDRLCYTQTEWLKRGMKKMTFLDYLDWWNV